MLTCLGVAGCKLLRQSGHPWQDHIRTFSNINIDMVFCDELCPHVEEPKGRVAGTQVDTDDEATAGINF
jgi:hypothetical protein